MGSFLVRMFKRAVTLAAFAIVGAAVIGVMNGGRDEAVAGGAVLGAGILLVFWLLRGVCRFLFGRRKKRSLATIVDITSTPPPGAPWYHHTYVLFDVRGSRVKLHLSPQQAKQFSENYSINDTGRLVWSGKRLIGFELPTPEAPLQAAEHPGRRRTVFISYAHGDDPGGQAAEYLAQVFRTAGLDAWLDRHELAAGDRLRDEIERKIASADYFVPVLTAEYMSSPWCLSEFETAADRGVAIVPVKTTEGRLVPPPDMRRLFEQKAGEPKYLDLTQRGYLNELRALAQRMAG